MVGCLCPSGGTRVRQLWLVALLRPSVGSLSPGSRVARDWSPSNPHAVDVWSSPVPFPYTVRWLRFIQDRLPQFVSARGRSCSAGRPGQAVGRVVGRRVANPGDEFVRFGNMGGSAAGWTLVLAFSSCVGHAGALLLSSPRASVGRPLFSSRRQSRGAPTCSSGVSRSPRQSLTVLLCLMRKSWTLLRFACGIDRSHSSSVSSGVVAALPSASVRLLSPSLQRSFGRRGLGVDVCSLGELCVRVVGPRLLLD